MPTPYKNVGILLLYGGLLAGQDAAHEAGVAREANRLDEAIVLYRKAVAEDPKWTEGWWYLGTLLYDRDDYPGAAAAFQHTAELDPKNGSSLIMLGLSEAKLNQPTEALTHLRHGRKLGIPDDPQLRHVMLFTLGTLYLERGVRGDFEDAQEALDALARDGVESNELTKALGLAVLRASPLAERDPQMVRDAGAAEVLASQRGQVVQARLLYEQLAARYSKVSGVQFALGKFLLANHYDDEAVAAFRRELENTPDHLMARLGMAGVLAQLDPASGLPYAKEALKIAPELPETHYLVGVILMDIGEPSRAIVELEIARRAEPNEAKVYFALGQAYAKINRKEDAARARATFTRLNVKAPNE